MSGIRSIAFSRVLGLVLALVLALALAAPAAAAPQKPRLIVEPGAGTQRILVDVEVGNGQVRRSLLRVTPAAVTPGATGWDPAGRAAFVTWQENGERWFSAARDAARTWSEPRAIATTLRLRAGAAEPGRPMPAVAASLALPPEGRLFVVQFRTLGLPEWRDALQNAGAEVLSYLPFNAHIVRVHPALVPALAALDFVERVEPYHPGYRIEEELADWLRSEAGPAEFRVRSMAFEWGPDGKERIRQAAEADGARVATWFPSGHILELWVSRDQLRHLAAHDEVLWIDRWSAPENDMDLVRADSGANWSETNYNTCGQGVRGEVLDGGFESTHMDFDGVLLHGSNSAASHGTSTYGIVFGNGNRDGDGNAQGTGQLVCSGVQGIAADYDFMTDRFAETQQLKVSPYFASFQSNSWGDALTTQYTSISNQMDDIIWRLDIAIAQSQSNAGTQSSRPQAWAKNIISVGGIYHQNTLSTADDAWQGGASIGPAADGRLKPDVSYWYDSIYTTTSGNTYTTSFGGTSAATPEVAGVIGLIVQQWSDNVWGTNPQGSTVFERQPHASTIKALLINSSQQYPFTGTTSDLTRTHQGWGRPSARVARERAANSLVVDQATPLQLNQTATYNVAVASGTADLKVTMVYPDPPGTTSSTLHRINDLNLKVTSPSGTIYWGNNGLAAGNWSTSGGSANTKDTVENVFVQNPQAGTWSVEVSAAEINQDAYLATPEADAVFALVATGGIAQPAFCGNGVKEGGESCDGLDLGSQTCTSLGFGSGTLSCTASCTFNTSQCGGICKPAGQTCTANAECCSGSCKNGKTRTCR
ncbi:MAG TPA: S8 family serine peptidase [Thermoanaerobaculia bacterium]|nr:S8 family serine peptidase [Thermoanaerobaculia bacterium]